jgi:hypothetical protein
MGPGAGEGLAHPQAPHPVDEGQVEASQLLLRGTDDDCPFTEAQVAAFGAFMGTGAIQPGSQVTYRQGWRLWCKDFLPALPPAQRPCNVFLDNVAGDLNRALYVLAFGKYLFDTRGWRGRQVTRNFAHVRYHFFSNIRDTAFLDHPIVGQARKAVQMDQGERVADVLRRVDSALLPMTYVLLDWAREKSWTATPWDTDKGRGSKATYLATSLLMDTGNRVSSATGPTTDKVLGTLADHGVKTAQLEITVSKPSSKACFALAGAPAVRSYLVNPKATKGATAELLFPRVESMTITFLTQKVVQDNKGAPDGLYYARREPRESRFMDDVLTWLLRCDKLTEEDYLFTTYQLSPKRNAKTCKRLLQRRDVATLVKAAATAHGFDPARFSTSSAVCGLQ